MENLKFGYDDNLGLPQDFAERMGCEIVPYHDLMKLVSAFDSGELHAIFLPAGTLPYVSNYQVLAQSLFGAEYKNSLKTNFVTTEQLSMSDIPSHILGRVNKGCTTSFWAPQIYLMKTLPEGTSLKFKDTKGFPDMLHQTAERNVDCSMVWDIIMEENPNDASKVQQLFFLDHLPTPIIIAKQNIPDFSNKLTSFVSTDDKAFFTAFTKPDHDSIDKFLQAVDEAKQHFNVIAD